MPTNGRRDHRRRQNRACHFLVLVIPLASRPGPVKVTSADEGQERKTVITKFLNGGEPQEIHFDFRPNAGRWLLDDVHSLSAQPWTLSEILKCAP